jgi:DDE superfamily endonuclease/Archaeal putative transposase ISC1217
MSSIPPEAWPLLQEFAPVFTQPTYRRFTLLLFAAILTTGRRTIANLLRTVGSLAEGDSASYQRVLSQAHWSGLQLSAVLCRFLLRHLWPQGRISLVGDDTVAEHRGKKVYGKARHRDPVRSSRSYTAYRYGHKWVVLAILVSFPFAARPWALPVLVTLYRSPEDNRRRGRRHQTPAELMQLLLRLLLRWFPDRQFVFAADSSYGTHALARFAQRQQKRLSLVSRFYPDANLYEPPPPYNGKGRPRQKGTKLPSPAQVAAQAPRTRLRVAWYGGGTRRVEVVTGMGQWYKSGQGLVAVRWVYVHDLSGTHRDEYFYSTDVSLTARQIIEEYTGRWNIETTFQECRAYVGLETTWGWSRLTVLRAEPCLFGLYTVVALLYAHLPSVIHEDWQVVWLGKEQMTFSDAITAVRRWLWTDWVFAREGHDQAFAKLPQPLQEVLLYALAPAA